MGWLCSCIRIISQLYKDYNLSGWRKFKDWRKQIKKLMRKCAKISKAGGANKEERLKDAAKEYLKKAIVLKEKITESLNELKEQVLEMLVKIKVEELDYFSKMVSKHIDLIDRRIIKGEKIPHEEKVFSLFEAHTE